MKKFLVFFLLISNFCFAQIGYNPVAQKQWFKDTIQVSKAIRINVGASLNGKILTSDAEGRGTWQTPSSVTPSALTKVDDTNVTLTLGGTPSTALLQATSLTLGWTGVLASGRGGTDAWVDYSATSTIVGWSSFTTKQILYQVRYKSILVSFYLQGTSNSTSTTFTLPTAMSAVEFMEMCRNNDNGVSGSGRYFISASGSTVTFNQAVGGGSWTASGTKSIMGFFIYKID